MSAFQSYVINLPERLDRRQDMEKQLRKIGWQAEFFPALRPTETGGFPSIGARGCFLSHLAALKHGGALDQHILLMEDDLSLVQDFSLRWREVFEELEAKEWSLFYPGHVLQQAPKGLSLVPPSLGIVCSHFLMINRSAVFQIIQGLEAILQRPPGHPEGGPMHVDGAYSTIRQQKPWLQTYVYFPSLGRQRPSRSDIASPRFYDRVQFARSLLTALRRIKGKIG